jgi:hypothetical protein
MVCDCVPTARRSRRAPSPLRASASPWRPGSSPGNRMAPRVYLINLAGVDRAHAALRNGTSLCHISKKPPRRSQRSCRASPTPPTSAAVCRRCNAWPHRPGVEGSACASRGNAAAPRTPVPRPPVPWKRCRPKQTKAHSLCIIGMPRALGLLPRVPRRGKSPRASSHCRPGNLSGARGSGLGSARTPGLPGCLQAPATPAWCSPVVLPLVQRSRTRRWWA